MTCSSWNDENYSVSCMLHTSLQNRTSLSLLISLALHHAKFQHIPIKFLRYLKWNTVTRTDTAGYCGKENLFFSSPSPAAGRSEIRLYYRRVNPAGRDSLPESPRMLWEGYLHIFCASVAWTISGDFSSQSQKCMQIKLWHKQALEDEYCSSKKPPSSPIEQTACFSC